MYCFTDIKVTLMVDFNKFEFTYKGFLDILLPTMVIEYNGKFTFRNLKIISKFARAFADKDDYLISVRLYRNGIYDGCLDCFPKAETDSFIDTKGNSVVVYRN